MSGSKFGVVYVSTHPPSCSLALPYDPSPSGVSVISSVSHFV